MPLDVERLIERLEIIIDQVTTIEEEVAGVSFREFAANRSLKDLTAFRVQTIGENCHRLGDDVKARHPDLPWDDIYGMRNIIAHDYGRINPATVWNVARDHLGQVRQMASAELARTAERDGPSR